MPITWHVPQDGPVITPGQLNPGFDDAHAGAGHVVRVGDRLIMAYWASGRHENAICAAEAPLDDVNAWRGVGCWLTPRDDAPFLAAGPRFPWLLPLTDSHWQLYFLARGRPTDRQRWPSTIGVAESHDAGATWTYLTDEPIVAPDRPYDREATGSLCVFRAGDGFRMIYTGISAFVDAPPGARVGDPNPIMRIGLCLAESDDGVTWHKPLDEYLIAPRGFAADPYEHYVAKPCVVPVGDGYRMWVSARGFRYRIRSLISADGLHWRWLDAPRPDGTDSDLPNGSPGGFDSKFRCYASVVRIEDNWHMWFSGNGYGRTGMGYAVGEVTETR